MDEAFGDRTAPVVSWRNAWEPSIRPTRSCWRCRVGGVPVAAEVAIALHAPLDLLRVRKIGASDQRELAVAAIAEGPDA